MARLADSTSLLFNGATVPLRPCLRAALRLARQYVTFGPVLSGISEGSVTIIGRVIGECGGGTESPASALADLFTVPGRPLAARIAKLQPIALDLVYGLLGIDPDAKQTPADKTGKPADLVEGFEDLFGFATGILKWTPADAWAATPGEIIAAGSARQKAFMSPEEREKQRKAEHLASLPVADRVRAAFANIGSRAEDDAS